MLRGRREAPGAVVGGNSVQKASECYVTGYFGGDKGVTLEILQAWRRRNRKGSRRFRGWGREIWISVFWYRYRSHPGWRIILCVCTTEVDGRVARVGCGHSSPRRKSGGGQKRVKRVNNRRVSYVTIHDGL